MISIRGFLSRRILVVALAIVLAVPAQSALSIQEPYRILISNDDGFQAPGIKALFDRLKELGEVTVAAPAANQSGVGHALTFGGPITVESWESESGRWFAIAASPATCVRLALTNLLPQLPDIVVSGINKGENAGVGAFSSGTVACAREAAYRGIPALAVSLEEGTRMDYAGAADFIARLILEIKEKGLPPGTFLNVNLPGRPSDQIKGVLMTRQDKRPPDEHYAKKTAQERKTEYWSVYRPLTGGDKDSDTWALTQGYISITPMTIDQTRSAGLDSLRTWDILKPEKEAP
ncbi:MAG: 5'/3'-nucleotidase SurE [Candidatus Aminicenantales bacterium]